MTPRLKICCIASINEARMAIDAGANAIGLVSTMPSGPGPISIDAIAAIVEGLCESSAIDTFLLTCATGADRIVDQLRRTRCNTIQLCDALDSPDEYAKIREALPAVKIVQVIHVEDEISLDEAFRAQEHVDALLLDSGRPKAAIKELGGTGRSHDWTLSRRIVGASTVPVWLAGGLNAANVAQAIRDVGPYGVDLCSGIRTSAMLDAEKVKRFTDAMRASASGT